MEHQLLALTWIVNLFLTVTISPERETRQSCFRVYRRESLRRAQAGTERGFLFRSSPFLTPFPCAGSGAAAIPRAMLPPLAPAAQLHAAPRGPEPSAPAHGGDRDGDGERGDVGAANTSTEAAITPTQHEFRTSGKCPGWPQRPFVGVWVPEVPQILCKERCTIITISDSWELLWFLTNAWNVQQTHTHTQNVTVHFSVLQMKFFVNFGLLITFLLFFRIAFLVLEL